MNSLYTLKENLNENGIFLCFRGPFSQELMVEVGALLKDKMASEDASPSTIFKVFSIFVEQSQNIIHHSADKLPDTDPVEADPMSGVVAVGVREGTYFVSAGNRIKNSEIDQLQGQLTQLQHMDRDALNQLYREQRRNRTGKGQLSGGLGLIELARKASQPIEFHFEAINDKISFFIIKAVINS